MEKINILDPTTTNKVISIVNDLVFTENYQTIEQSHSHIREKLKECFDDFLDGDQKDLLDEKIKNMKITRCFQILGSRNSISKFLLEKQTKIFNENRKTPITLDIEYLLTLSKQPYSYLLNKIQESTDIKNFFAEICNQIDFDINLFYDSDNFDIFREKIQTIYAEIKKQPYSKNPQENEQMEYLEQYVDSYKDYLKSQGQNQDYYNNIEKIKEFDPLFNQLTKHLPEEEKEVCCEGFFNKNTDQIGAFSCRGNIYLGIDPEGGIIFHEAFHALLGKIAGKNNDLAPLHYANNQQSSFFETTFLFDSYFNEVITEYFSQEVYDKISKNSPLTKNTSHECSYTEILLKYLKPLIETFREEIKYSLTTDNPTYTLASYIGGENLNRIMTNCNTIYNMANDLVKPKGWPLEYLDRSRPAKELNEIIHTLIANKTRNGNQPLTNHTNDDFTL